MHGRLKIKTTAEQAAEKQKEREQKRKLYLGGITQAFAKRTSNIHDEEGLKITAQLLTANPDAATLWNFRREILLAMKEELDEEKWSTKLLGEMGVVESCLGKNHKSYGAWHHRAWVMNTHPAPPWKDELKLCNKYLKMDERNFHCWDYRRFVVMGSKQGPEEELQFTRQLIEHNMSNYSAWHYRSKLLPLVHPPPPSTPHPISEAALIKELQTVVEAVFTDPSDQSPWFFLRWLVNRQEPSPRLVQVGYIEHPGAGDRSAGQVIVVFSGAVGTVELPGVAVDRLRAEGLVWTSPGGHRYSNVWYTELYLPNDSEHHTLTIKCDSAPERTLAVGCGVRRAVEWVGGVEAGSEELTDTARSTLEEVRENCSTLDELDPDNKWVLITLVDVLWALDPRSHQRRIHHHLSQLQHLDPLRATYYGDTKSKLAMETSLEHHRIEASAEGQGGEAGRSFSMLGRSLTRVTSAHLLANAERVNLANNELRSVAPLSSLIACQELVLDGNKISDLTPLTTLSSLTKLSLAGNKIKSVSQVTALTQLKNLESLNLKGNPVCEDEEATKEIMEALGNLKELVLR
ncbi:hypothetical protein Pmani_007472 [Petrolisthes manimaculis]|uniref:Geranylgeranyl transferase type-2 subunit alpha n=1 Tax=Petrolisthes manimaculis TaxID=1843537 RepID=A0AAE1Q8Q0_9EUCA|nr:hypothetical protein Pmani_007472 [Petrolisthes manimaculis]